MNFTYFRIDLLRQLRDIGNTAIIIGLPVIMYLVFGSTGGSGDQVVGSANEQFYVMVSMAVYGAAMATTSIAGIAAIERIQGWGRQLALTPMTSTGFVVTKVTVALTYSFFAAGAVFIAGALTGAEGSASVWIRSFLLVWLTSGLFALFGLAIAQLFKSESAVSIATAGLVLLSFLGNLFVPLSGTMLNVARFTPMYGISGLARWPQMHGAIIDNTVASMAEWPHDSLWALILNVLVWALIFGGIATLAVTRSRKRQ
ncbi:MAG: ABC transporter permease [Cellulomonadaceae bacterium]|jgi:ABC-2 type transport system permease protein|nr:ABC transporter permease [Cellulomonadaceae bacterium]